MSKLIDTGKIKSAVCKDLMPPGKAVIKATLSEGKCSVCRFDFGLFDVDGYKYCRYCGALVLVDKKVTERERQILEENYERIY